MIYLDTGHGLHNARPGVYDPGATGSGTTEAEVVREVARAVLTRLAADRIPAQLAPDGNLASVRLPWQRRTLTRGDLLVSLHMNAGGGTGTEVLYSADRPALAEGAMRLSALVATGLGLRNRGAKPDTESHVGHVGILRASDVGTTYLLEMGFIDSAEDCKVVQVFGPAAVAEAIARMAAIGLGPWSAAQREEG
jgi:N-acetylmuramoyl-L-alanine amidase